MSDDTKKTEELLELTAEELAEFEKLDVKSLKVIGEKISILVRSLEGQSFEDHITMLTNTKNIYERSRFPTYPILTLIVYLRLIYWTYGEVAVSCEEWAKKLSESLISYKGKGREEFVEMTKASSVAQQEFIIGGTSKTPTSSIAPKKSFFDRFRRSKKPDPSEFGSE